MNWGRGFVPRGTIHARRLPILATIGSRKHRTTKPDRPAACTRPEGAERAGAPAPRGP